MFGEFFLQDPSPYLRPRFPFSICIHAPLQMQNIVQDLFKSYCPSRFVLRDFVDISQTKAGGWITDANKFHFWGKRGFSFHLTFNPPSPCIFEIQIEISIKHHKSCKCRPVPLIIARSQIVSGILFLNCQNCNQCLKSSISTISIFICEIQFSEFYSGLLPRRDSEWDFTSLLAVTYFQIQHTNTTHKYKFK